MGHYVMVGDRPVATGSDYSEAQEGPAEVRAERPQPEPEAFYCQFCTPPRPFSSEHALKTHQGRMHPAEKARQNYAKSVKERKERNVAREVE